MDDRVSTGTRLQERAGGETSASRLEVYRGEWQDSKRAAFLCDPLLDHARRGRRPIARDPNFTFQRSHRSDVLDCWGNRSPKAVHDRPWDP
jgi:hypothetical protein